MLAGSEHGLSLILNLEQYEYMKGPNNDAGIKVRQPSYHVYTDYKFTGFILTKTTFRKTRNDKITTIGHTIFKNAKKDKQEFQYQPPEDVEMTQPAPGERTCRKKEGKSTDETSKVTALITNP